MCEFYNSFRELCKALMMSFINFTLVFYDNYFSNYPVWMKNKKQMKILVGIVLAVFLIIFLTILSVKPWIRKKIETTLNKENSDYIVTIDKVKTSIIPSGLELEGINIVTKKDYSGIIDLKGDIGSLRVKGINLLKAIFKKDINIRKIIISEISFNGKISSPGDTLIPIVLPVNLRIGIVLIDKINLSVEKSVTKASYSLTDGVLRFHDLYAEKHDTLSSGIINQFDFEAGELAVVSADGMHTFKSGGIIYSAYSGTLAIKSFFIQPNYPDYDFTSRYTYQKTRIEAAFSNIHVNDFNMTDFIRSGNLVSSGIEIGKMDIKAFKDKRKEFKHVNKPAFQDMIYNYPATINIDLISLKNGDAVYTEHSAEANEPGRISFNDINAKIYKITNDPVYRKKTDSLKFIGNAMLMGKGKMTVLLKGRIFDSQNTFSLDGTLSDLDAAELNPILEKSAYVFATSGKIDSMNFSFTANNDKATGKLTMLYHGLEIAVKNKQTDDTTAFRERFISVIANMKVLDSNPVRGKDPREGNIYFEQNHEKFLFHYCFQAILTGITSSLVSNPKDLSK
jgi:hypothetical protein